MLKWSNHMLTDQDILIIENRKIAAQSSLKFFKYIVPVRSINTPDALLDQNERRTTIDRAVLKDYRDKCKYKPSLMKEASYAIKTGVGNCREKVFICYTSLSCNPRLTGNSEVIMCAIDATDHAFLLITDKINPFLTSPSIYQRIEYFSSTTIIVDPLALDWYFPNLNSYTESRYKLGSMTTEFQENNRTQCKNNEFRKFIIPM